MMDIFDTLLKIEQQTQNTLFKFGGGEPLPQKEAPTALVSLESKQNTNKPEASAEQQNQLTEARRLQTPLNDRARILFEGL